jgi:hypothetical protein
MVNIEELTIKQARELAALLNPQPASVAATNPFRVGKNYFIRTVTHHHTGRLAEVTPTELVLEDAAWIADSGRFADALKSCSFNEVEPFPSGRVIIGRGALVDAVEISTIPLSQK